MVKIWLRRVEYSVEGNPPKHKSAVQGKTEPLRWMDELTLYVDVGRPVALNVRLHSQTSAMQGRVILITDSSCRSIEIMESVG